MPVFLNGGALAWGGLSRACRVFHMGGHHWQIVTLWHPDCGL